jgi:hypothetical protein
MTPWLVVVPPFAFYLFLSAVEINVLMKEMAFDNFQKVWSRYFWYKTKEKYTKAT